MQSDMSWCVAATPTATRFAVGRPLGYIVQGPAEAADRVSIWPRDRLAEEDLSNNNTTNNNYNNKVIVDVGGITVTITITITKTEW